MKLILVIGIFCMQNKAFAQDYNYPKFANPNISSKDNFVTIKAGSFKMGSPLSEYGRNEDEALHDVTITKDFEIQITVVTQGQFFLAMGFNPSSFKTKGYCEDDYVQIKGTDLCPNNPVDRITWNDTQELIKNLNAAETQYQYRLPTEAEWEYSARGGSQTSYWHGADTKVLDDYVWYSHNSGGYPHSVGTKPANPFGLFDAVGNISQWVQDRYGKYPATHQTDPIGADSGWYHVVRGGNYSHSAPYVRVANRAYGSPSAPYYNIGFRLVRTTR